jgi:hypothetical protein
VSQPAAVELAPHYYRDNFQSLCDTVQGRYSDLLTQRELDLLACWRRLSFPAQCLFVRLVSRVGPWFRESRLDYPEIGPLAAPLDELLEQGLAALAEGLDAEALGRLFTLSELRRAFGALLPAEQKGGKTALLAAINDLDLSDSELLAHAAILEPRRVIAPLGGDTVGVLQTLFFGNRRQSLTEFVLSDLGVARYYPYSLERSQRLFPRRQALDEYLHCCTLSDLWHELREAGDGDGLRALYTSVAAQAPAFTPGRRRWFRLCNGLARDLERLGCDDDALALYCRSELHPARERAARILERRQDWAGAAARCEAILAAPWGEEEYEAATRILARVRRKLGVPAQPRRRDDFTRMDLRLAPADEAVEQLAAQALAGSGRSVYYVENSLFNALFGLAFWEQIFAPVPGAFNHPYQSAPADMYHAGFRQRREEALTRRLTQLRTADLGQLLPAAWDSYRDYQCRWVNWRYIDRELVAAASAIIPAAQLCAIWERLLFDPGDNRRGFPDLLALGQQPGDYQLIEVKGPGDSLQDSQKRWLRFFAEQGIPAAVAWVSWRHD